MPPTAPQEAFADLSYPVHGLDLTGLFSGQLPETTRDAANVRAFEPTTLRARGGSRPGLAKFVDSQLPLTYSSGLRVIQNLQTVVTTDGTALLNAYPFEGPLVWDPSDVGLASSWPPGRNSRVPDWAFPYGGTPIMPYKGGLKTPVLTWADPADITATTALSATQLNATATDHKTGASVPGSFSYSPASGSFLSAGLDQALRVTFTPTDTATYNTTKGLAHIDVLPAGPLAFVQAKGSGIVGQSAVAAYDSSVGAGDLLIAAVYVNCVNEVPAISTPTDSLGTAYLLVATVAVDVGGLQHITAWLYYGVAPSAGANTVTATATLGNPLNLENIECNVAEYSGTAASPLDAFNTGTSFPATGSGSTGVIALSAAGELLVVTFVNCTPDTATTRVAQSSVLADTYPVSVAVALTASGGTLGAGQVQIAIGASFKPA